MPTDFRNGEFPRRGRDALDGFLWLARVFDKARAARDGTIFDYIYPCPMDRAVFDRRDDANRWLLDEKGVNLDRQDAEEGVVPA